MGQFTAKNMVLRQSLPQCTIGQETPKALTTFSFDLKRTEIVPELVHMSFYDSLDVFEHIFIDFGFFRVLYTPYPSWYSLRFFLSSLFVTENKVNLKGGGVIN